MKVLFVNDSTDNSNWGDRAAAITLKRMVKRLGGTIHGSLAERHLASGTYGMKQEFSNGKKYRYQHLIRKCTPPILFSIKNRIRSYFTLGNEHFKVPGKWKYFKSCKSDLYRKTEFSKTLGKKIENVDIVVIHGDGAITGSRCMPRAMLFLAYVIKNDFDRPVVMANHTVDLNDQSLSEIAANVYPSFDDVVYREEESATRNHHICGGRAAADSAFILKPAPKKQWLGIVDRPNYFDVWPDRAEFDPSEPYICIGGSSIYTEVADGYDPFVGFSSLIDYLRTCYAGQIVLAVSAKRDEWFLRKIAEEQDLPVLGLCTPVQQAVDVVGNADAYIGGRWHPSIFALSGGTPVVALSAKTFKMQSLMVMSGLGRPYSALALEEEKEKIGDRLLTYITEGISLRGRLRRWARKQEKLSWENVAYLRGFNDADFMQTP